VIVLILRVNGLLSFYEYLTHQGISVSLATVLWIRDILVRMRILYRVIVLILRVNGLLSFYEYLTHQGISVSLATVLWIRDILVRMRIRILIRGSVPLTNGSGFESCCFHSWLSRRQQKTTLKKFSALFLSEGTFTSFF
jgi:hypothetical protein